MHYKYNTRLDTPFWRECRGRTDLAGAAPVVEYDREHGPSGYWGPTLLDPMDPFKMGGYATMLTRMRVPYRRTHTLPASEVALSDQRRRQVREMALRGVSVREALDAVHAPGWTWDPPTPR